MQAFTPFLVARVPLQSTTEEKGTLILPSRLEDLVILVVNKEFMHFCGPSTQEVRRGSLVVGFNGN